MTASSMDTTKYNNMVNNASSGTVISSTIFKDFIGDVKTVVDQHATEVNAHLADKAAHGFMQRQAIINGNFDVAQRGKNFVNPAVNIYTLDRWTPGYNADGGTLPTTITHSQLNLTPGEVSGASYGYRINVDGAGSAFGVNAEYLLAQKIENGTRYLCGSNKKVTVTFWARSSIANKRLGVSARQNYGSGGTPSSPERLVGQIITLTSTWTKYKVTITTNTLVGKTFGTNNDDRLQVDFHYLWGTSTATVAFGGGTAETFGGAGNIDIAQVHVHAGDADLPFPVRTFAQELALCQRYFEKSYNIETLPGTVTNTGEVIGQSSGSVAGSTAGAIIMPCHDVFKVWKRIAPTVILYSTGTGAANAIYVAGSSDRTGATASGSSQKKPVDFISLDASSATAIGDRTQIQYHWTADAEL